MTNRLLIKRSSTANSVPTAGDLDYGEIAINYRDGNLFFKDVSNAIQTIASTQFVSVSGNVSGNNFSATNAISAGGNITAGNASITANVSAGNISTTGNITANYFFGDGSGLSNITVSGNAIQNGNSNVTIATAGGNVDIAVNGLAQSAQFSEGAFYVAGPIATPKSVNHTSFVHTDVNAIMISPVTILSNGNIVVPSSSTLTIFTPS